MIERAIFLIGASSVALAVALAARWSTAVAAGILVGGAWNLLNLWCLARAVRSWLAAHPSRPRTIAWILVKFPLLYALAIGYLLRPRASAMGFGIGFLIVLIAALAAGLINPVSRPTSSAHGR